MPMLMLMFQPDIISRECVSIVQSYTRYQVYDTRLDDVHTISYIIPGV